MVSVTNASPNGLQTTHVCSVLDAKKLDLLKKICRSRYNA